MSELTCEMNAINEQELVKDKIKIFYAQGTLCGDPELRGTSGQRRKEY